MEPIDPSERRRRGAWYTPPAFVQFLVDQAVAPAASKAARAGRPLRVLDPACGDGRLLAAAGELVCSRVARRFAGDSPGDDRPSVELVGVEIDAGTAAAARVAVPEARIVEGDGRLVDPGGPFDVVIGNPPYLGQLGASATRGGRSALGGGPYADVAAEFLVRAVALTRPDGGRVALVIPQSILASRDTAEIRTDLLERAALEGIWWAGCQVFAARVNVCIVVLLRGARQGPVRRWKGLHLAPQPDAPASAVRQPTWSRLIADLAGIPPVELPAATGRLGDLATATAGFRQQYYGLVPFVQDDRAGSGSPLVTAGLVDVGACGWGRRPARFAKRSFAAPRVDLTALAAADHRLSAWVRRQLQPKVLVATQTRVIEAVADPTGSWLPSVPVIAVHPRRPVDLWRIAAVLTAPPLSALAASQYLGAGLGASALKLSGAQLLELPLPCSADPWHEGAGRLARGDVAGCARAMLAAYGLRGAEAARVLAWWEAGAGLGRAA